MGYGKLKVKFKNDRHNKDFKVLSKPVVKGESILEVDTPTGSVFVNMDETYYIEYERG